MKALVIYDSKFGNTEQIARAVGEAIGSRVLPVAEVTPAELQALDLVFIGSPTHGSWFTEGIKDLLEASPALENVRAAVFDTRTKKSLFGFAAPRMARRLEKNGGQLAAPPEGFIVLGMEGPLKEGELERAASWAAGIAR